VQIYISADIEGIAGVVTPQQGQPGNSEYERGRRLMTEEVNAAIAGAFDSGATEVLVNDAHGPMVNLLPDLLDERAELLLGKPKPCNMFAGLTPAHTGVMCIGYHAGASRPGVLAHTVYGFAFREIRVNGLPCSEATLYGAYAGSLGVPVIMISGDDVTAAECGSLFPGVKAVVVKWALGARAARALSPARARSQLRAAAAQAVASANAVAPFCIPGPYRLEVDLSSPVLADLAAIIPVAERIGPTTIGFSATAMPEVLGWVNTLSALSSTLR
jgi:D-amino peptidase